jgi:hypothetical protein
MEDLNSTYSKTHTLPSCFGPCSSRNVMAIYYDSSHPSDLASARHDRHMVYDSVFSLSTWASAFRGYLCVHMKPLSLQISKSLIRHYICHLVHHVETLCLLGKRQLVPCPIIILISNSFQGSYQYHSGLLLRPHHQYCISGPWILGSTLLKISCLG